MLQPRIFEIMAKNSDFLAFLAIFDPFSGRFSTQRSEIEILQLGAVICCKVYSMDQGTTSRYRLCGLPTRAAHFEDYRASNFL